MEFLKWTRGRRRIVTLRSSALWQVELALAGWAVVCAALASYVAEAKPYRLDDLPLGVSPLGAVGLLFASGLLAGLALRSLLLRWDFRLVTDEATYFFFDDGEMAVFLPRGSIRSVRHEAEGIVVETEHGTVRVGGGRPLLLIAVSNLLERWAQEGQVATPHQGWPPEGGSR